MNVSPNRVTSARPAGGVTRPPVHRPRRGAVLAVVCFLSFAVGSGMALFLTVGRPLNRPVTRATHTVAYEKLHDTVVARGELEPAEQSEVYCRVKGMLYGRRFAAPIKWVVDNGVHVRRGDLLVELDDAAFQEELENRKELLEEARAACVIAAENYKIVECVAQEAIALAEIAVQLAELDLKKYLLGDYRQARQELEGKILLAESSTAMWRDRVSWSKLMFRKGFLSSAQSQADQGSLQAAEIALENLRQELRVLEGYTRVQTQTELEQNKLRLAQDALQRSRGQAKAQLTQAELQRLTKKRIYQRRLIRLREVQAEIAKCKIRSPRDGTVIYHVPPQAWVSSGQPIIAQGEPTRDGQLLMHIADLSHLQARVWIQEALVARVRGEVRETPSLDTFESLLYSSPGNPTAPPQPRLLAPGQEATIHVDASPEVEFHGHVKQVSTMPTQLNGRPEDVKVFQAVVDLDGPVEQLKPDETAEVHIAIDIAPQPVLAVPVQAIFGDASLGSHRECLVVTAAGVEQREVVVGIHNGDWAEIKSGLEAGEHVLLDPDEFKESKAPSSP